jgi:DNA-directed RNA polymerase specialized sigma24 family protein
MPTDDPGSVTSWIELIKKGDHEAAQMIWERYFVRLVGLARARLASRPRRAAVVDEEDAALSAFDSFYVGAGKGRYPSLKDREDLWRLLVVITARKVSDQVRSHGRQKRGGGRVMGELAMPGGESEREGGLDRIIGHEPSPEFAAMVADELRHLLDILDDPTIRLIALWRLEGYTRDEMAVKLGCARRTVGYKLDFIRKSWSAKEARGNRDSRKN